MIDQPNLFTEETQLEHQGFTCEKCRDQIQALQAELDELRSRALKGRGVRTPDRSGSKKAWVYNESKRNTHKGKILNWFRARPGVWYSPDDVSEGTGISYRSCPWKRCQELYEAGYLDRQEDAGIDKAGQTVMGYKLRPVSTGNPWDTNLPSWDK